MRGSSQGPTPISSQLSLTASGECAGLTEELEEVRKVSADTVDERDEATARGDDLATQLELMTAERDSLR